MANSRGQILPVDKKQILKHLRMNIFFKTVFVSHPERFKYIFDSCETVTFMHFGPLK